MTLKANNQVVCFRVNNLKFKISARKNHHSEIPFQKCLFRPKLPIFDQKLIFFYSKCKVSIEIDSMELVLRNQCFEKRPREKCLFKGRFEREQFKILDLAFLFLFVWEYRILLGWKHHRSSGTCSICSRISAGKMVGKSRTTNESTPVANLTFVVNLILQTYVTTEKVRLEKIPKK